MAVDIPTYAYAVCVAVGGVVGYVKAGSMISLAMGLTSGALLGLGAYQTSQDPSNFYLPLVKYGGGGMVVWGVFFAAGVSELVRCGKSVNAKGYLNTLRKGQLSLDELCPGVSSTLLGVMGYRFYESGKFMPAGMVATMSLLFVVRFGMRMLGN